MTTVFEEYATEERRSVVRLLWVKRTVYGGKCLSRKAVRNWVEKFSQGFRKSQMMPDQVPKWLRQPSQDKYAAGFDALVKR
jgi:hypothetical protein